MDRKPEMKKPKATALITMFDKAGEILAPMIVYLDKKFGSQFIEFAWNNMIVCNRKRS